jgi:cell wall assembly regulator SMI1
MKQSTLESLDRLFAEMPMMRAPSVGTAEIDSAQRTLGVTFSDDYREFLSRYGGAMVGPYPVYGLSRAEPMDTRLWSVVDVTEHFRQQSWPGSDKWYVISMDHAGNPVGIDPDGMAISFDHDAGEMVLVAESLDAYLQYCLART